MAAVLDCALGSAVCFAADLTDKQQSQVVATPANRALRLPARAATLTERLLSDARDRQLDDFAFPGAVLIASGTQTGDEIKKFTDVYVVVRAGILSQLPSGTAIDRLKAIHSAAHRCILTGSYRESCSDLRMTFTTGDFNCLTSLAVCYDLCQSAGLDVQPMLIPGHVLLAYNRPNGQMNAFEPSTTEWLARPLTKVSGTRTLSPLELIGKFYYNRGVEQLRLSDYETGLSLLRTSLALDAADDDARANLVAGLNNWAAERAKAGRLAEAALLIEQGRALDPGFAPLIVNEQFVREKLAN
jgi:hypothetical protein